MTNHSAETLSERKDFYQRISGQHLTPLWEVLHALVPPQPQTPCVPAHWRYADVRPHLMAAGQLITAEEAVRRVLILENPALRGQSAITQSLYAGLQLILPGEVAPAHRHTQSALRFIVEGSGAYTAVAGERTTMHPGDFIITPNWAWHDHGHRHGSESAAPVVWLDGLDIPMLRFFDAGFAENATEASQQVGRAEGLSFAQWGNNMAPLEPVKPFGATSPVFNYPYSRTAEALHALSKSQAAHPAHGHALRYTNPQTGGSPMPTMGTQMQLLPAGFGGQAHRQTAGRVFSVVEGSGTARVRCGDVIHSFEFAARDHFVVPSWWSLSFETSVASATLFSYSDKPVHQALSIFREEFLPGETKQ